MAMLCSDLCLYAFRHVLYLDLHMYMLMCQLSNVLPCLCASFHMFTCVLSCLCLDLHLHMFVCLDLCSACFMPSSMYLYSPFHVCVPRPRIRLSCHVLLQLFCRFIFLSCILAYWFEPNIDPVVFAIIHAPWPTSKGLDHPFCMSIMLICLMPLSYTLCISFAIACLLVSCLCLCMYTHGARAQSPRRRQNGQGNDHVDMGQVARFNKYRSLAFPFWLCTISNPFLPPPFLSQMVCIRYIMSCTIRPHLQSMATPVVFLHLYFGPCSRDVGIYFSTLCACIVHDVCIYIPASPLWCDYHSLCHLRQVMPNFCRESKVTCCQIFVVEIWHFARMPQESIDWDHTH